MKKTQSNENHLWYRDAVIYEVPIRSFCDSNGDGTGDLKGLTGKLDYLKELGINALWLLPFYPSPMRDGGYDIADYLGVDPQYGSLDDFKELLKAAHERGIRVITELVLNHTSDRHEWFQRSRRAKPGSPWRDFYIWNKTPEKFGKARIIFKDFEISNWAWDDLAGAYYWHRFYSHQPDLNYDNPLVKEEIFRVVDFWLEMGVDGLRLDAVPYLFKREETDCENLPETHAFLKELRSHIDSRFEGRMLLAEANQWPEDARAYFGDGDECQLAFHFPLMPRLYIALEKGDRSSVVDILERTPPIPDNCWWAVFLRNHDELTLEMVTEEEREFMYQHYAPDPPARINLGIRHRLAPLLNNSRPKIEMLNLIIFTIPGIPVIYYGDEIGMGDNYLLPDRDGLRTPMQWSPGINGGFSRADPNRLYLPPIADSSFNCETVNVRDQERDHRSLLKWMSRLIRIRKNCRTLSRGTLRFLTPAPSEILAFLRIREGEDILVACNLSNTPLEAELDLKDYNKVLPVDLFRKRKLPPIGKAPYPLTFGPHEYYLLSLKGKNG
jgi:maltose alpha-D-glucosyltransferase / alpha-amylase